MNAHVSLGFKTLKDPELIPFAQGVHDGITAHVSTFTNLPVTMVALLAAIADFTAKYNASIKGSVAQTQAKDASRTTLIGLLAQLAAYVEGVAQSNVDTIHNAGFMDMSHGHALQVPLVKPEIIAALNVASTQVQLRLKAQPNLHSVRVQWRTGTGPWQEGGSFASTKLVIVKDLTPGTIYEFRVLFIGGSTGSSEWSDAISHMCS